MLMEKKRTGRKQKERCTKPNTTPGSEPCLRRDSLYFLSCMKMNTLSVRRGHVTGERASKMIRYKYSEKEKLTDEHTRNRSVNNPPRFQKDRAKRVFEISAKGPPLLITFLASCVQKTSVFNH